MLRVKVPILEVTDDSQITSLTANKDNFIITESACEEAIKNYNKSEPIVVVLGKNPIGKLVNLEYDKEAKAVIGDLELYINFAGACSILSQLETPTGKRLLNVKLGAIQTILDVKEVENMLKSLSQKQGE